MFSFLQRRTKSVSRKPKNKTAEKITKKPGSKSDNGLGLLSKKETAHTSPVEEKLRTGKRRKEKAKGREREREREREEKQGRENVPAHFPLQTFQLKSIFKRERAVKLNLTSRDDLSPLPRDVPRFKLS